MKLFTSDEPKISFLKPFSTSIDILLALPRFNVVLPELDGFSPAPHKIALFSVLCIVLTYNPEGWMIVWRHYRITVEPYGNSRCVWCAFQLGRTSDGGGSGGTAVINLGNERNIPDHVPRAHGGPRSSANTSAVGGGTGGYEATASEVSSAAAEDNDRMPSRRC